jgi:hypothetical protein
MLTYADGCFWALCGNTAAFRSASACARSAVCGGEPAEKGPPPLFFVLVVLAAKEERLAMVGHAFVAAYACSSGVSCRSIRQHTSAYVSMCQHMSACVSIRRHMSAYVRTRQQYVSIRQQYVSIRLAPQV